MTEKKEKTEKKMVWPVIFLTSLIMIFALTVISSVLEIGERLGRINVWLEPVFYLLLLIVIAIGVIYPMGAVFFVPVFSLRKFRESEGGKRKKYRRMLIRNLLDNANLTDEERKKVESFAGDDDRSDDRIIEFFDGKIKSKIDNEISKAAKQAFMVTAVSQNALYDMLGMAVFNYKMIYRIIKICGFRATTLQVLNVYAKAMSYVLIAGTIEELDIEDGIEDLLEEGLDDMFPDAAGNMIGSLGGAFGASLLQGTFNALAIIRVAVVTKNYLLDADVSKTKKEIRRQSFKEAREIFIKANWDKIKANLEKRKNSVHSFFVKLFENAPAPEEDIKADPEKGKSSAGNFFGMFDKLFKKAPAQDEDA